ncbi:hypothetical protein HYALB_00001395 [Hymenoscyphus albidus]|uniref:Ribosomal protein/NADH dehydrogenase domain-containing protein n=1 Tax=Hymenoscyphus albidus TaxID=595503 RepID=A0A9N9LET5_9HELO|nr:hypothetical protein HYALB_00001395 [Hymenoscyphus albidus]
MGDGAIILPPEVKKIRMEFAIARDEGHTGPRLFWRNELRRIKYYNPALEVSIARTENPQDPALMTVFFATTERLQLPGPTPITPEASASTPQTDLTLTTPHRTEVFNIKNRGPSMILAQLLKLTNATPVEPTEEQLEQRESLKEYKAQSIKDHKRNIVRNARLKAEKEKEILMKGGLPA